MKLRIWCYIDSIPYNSCWWQGMQSNHRDRANGCGPVKTYIFAIVKAHRAHTNLESTMEIWVWRATNIDNLNKPCHLRAAIADKVFDKTPFNVYQSIRYMSNSCHIFKSYMVLYVMSAHHSNWNDSYARYTVVALTIWYKITCLNPNLLLCMPYL